MFPTCTRRYASRLGLGKAQSLVYFMKVEDFKKSREAAEKSPHPIDKYHQQFRRDTWEEQKQLELLVDLERIGEAT